MTKETCFYLASTSPRRAQLLQQIGVPFEICAVEVDENRLPTESPGEYVTRLALEKARHGRRQARRQLPVLGADTAVVLGDAILSKPGDRIGARAMLARLSGRTHQVLTAVAMVGEQEHVRINTNAVSMRAITESELDAYAASGEGWDKAGAYAVQGLAAIFINHINGSYSGVMGLPLFETAELLQHFSIKVLGHEW